MGSERDEIGHVDDVKDLTTTSRRGFLRIAGLAGVSLSLASAAAKADTEIGFWAKDLPDDKLVDMYKTILRIRWHERTMADKMLSDPDYRGYNHFYAGQEAVAVRHCATPGPMTRLIWCSRPIARPDMQSPRAWT